MGNMYPPHHLGGYELVWQSAVEHLRRSGHAVRVLTTDHTEPGVADAEEPDVHRELRSYWRDHAWPRLALRERFALERENGAVFDQHVANLRPDVLGWWSMGGMSLSLVERGRRAGLPAAGFVCDDWMLYGPLRDGWIGPMGRHRRVAAVADRLTRVPTRIDLGASGSWLFPSEMLRTRASAAHDLKYTDVVHQGVDHALFSAAPSKPWGWRLLCVGRLDPRKGVDLAVEALPHLPDEAVLTVVGDGDRAFIEQLVALARRAGVDGRVRFRGQLPREDLPAVYADADVLVFPVRWEEPWGLVPLEAMAIGTPVVASGRGGSGEYLRDCQNCVVFDPDGGPKELALALHTLSESKELRDKVRLQGIATSRSMDQSDFDLAVEGSLTRAASCPAT